MTEIKKEDLKEVYDNPQGSLQSFTFTSVVPALVMNPPAGSRQQAAVGSLLISAESSLSFLLPCHRIIHHLCIILLLCKYAQPLRHKKPTAYIITSYSVRLFFE